MPAAPLALGLDLGGTKLAAALLDASGATVWQGRWPTPAGDYAGTVARIAQAVQAAELHARQLGAAAPFGIGIATPGCETPAGVMKNCNSTCLNGRPLRVDIAAALGRDDIALANDANCLALSEAVDGAGAGARLVFAVILGTGVGGGLAIDGDVHAGPNGLAGEWGHNPLPWGDECDESGPDPRWACYCGRRGCIETLLSGPGLARDHAQATGLAAPLGGELIVQVAQAGDAAARAALDRHASRLARALASVVNTLDPDAIVLGGGLSRLPGLVDAVQSRWARWVFAGGAARTPLATPLRLSAHGDASGVRGAAWLGRQLQAGSTPRPGTR